MTSRGDRREDIYEGDQDRTAWLKVFGEVCDRLNWRCHAYCLMSNHYHIVVETIEGNLSRGMCQLNGVYTQAFNRRHRLSGHLFQGRFKGVLVERESYLMELSRYVVLNPVRARMVNDVGDWPWSSCGAMIGQQPAPAWLETDWLLGRFGHVRQAATMRYMDFVRRGVGLPSIWSEVRKQVFLGSERFAEQALEELNARGSLREVPQAQRRAKPLALSEYAERYKDSEEAMVCAYRSYGYTMQEIADYFGVHYATVSRAVKRHA